MELLGIRKTVDRLGRICIPKEMRKLFALDAEVELVVTKDGILIKNINKKNARKQVTPRGTSLFRRVFVAHRKSFKILMICQ